MTQDNLRVSYSSLGTMNSCARKFELNKLYLHPENYNEDSLAAEVGKAVHRGYQRYLATGDVDLGLLELGIAYPHHLCWTYDNDRSWEAAMASYYRMIEYAAYDDWQVANIKNHEGKTVPAIEVSFELVLSGITLPDGRGISYVGFIDAIMYQALQLSSFRTLDIKTHRDRTQDRTANYKFNSQQIPYGIVLEHVLGRSIEEFDVDYLDVFVDLLNPRVTPYTYTKDKELLREWLMKLLVDIRNLVTYMRMGLFPRADHGCTAFFRPCRYLDMCHLRDKELVQTSLLLDNEVKKEEPWKPWVKANLEIPTELLTQFQLVTC